jgi:hypothetical protein
VRTPDATTGTVRYAPRDVSGRSWVEAPVGRDGDMGRYKTLEKLWTTVVVLITMSVFLMYIAYVITEVWIVGTK